MLGEGVAAGRWAAYSVVADWVVGDRYHLSRIALWQALIGSAASAVVTIGGVMRVSGSSCLLGREVGSVRFIHLFAGGAKDR